MASSLLAIDEIRRDSECLIYDLRRLILKLAAVWDASVVKSQALSILK